MSRPLSHAVDAYQAIAHPLRRHLINILSKGKKSVRELVAGFDMTLPGLSRHLRILRQATLVPQRRHAIQRLDRLDQKSLRGCGIGLVLTAAKPPHHHLDERVGETWLVLRSRPGTCV